MKLAIPFDFCHNLYTYSGNLTKYVVFEISIKSCIQSVSYYLIVMSITMASFSFGISAMYGSYYAPENVFPEDAGYGERNVPTYAEFEGFVI